jgi:F-type H+-transporting ATPase subunit delta
VADDSKQADVGVRYAQALFELAKGQGDAAAVEADLKRLKGMRAESADLRTLIGSPAFDAEEKGKGLAAVAEAAEFNPTTRKFLGLVAANRRANVLPSMIAAFEKLAAEDRGAVSAEVVTAMPLTAAQEKALAAALRTALGKDPEVETRVDPAILGGIKVRVGSRLFDASLKSRLDSLKFALKRA